VGKDVYLIEFKDTVSGGSIFYEGSRGSSIEKKMCTVLRNLYQDANDRVTRAVSSWDRRREPVFMLVANHYTERARAELGQLLKARARQWQFAYQIVEWTGQKAVSIMNTEPSVGDESARRLISFPEMPSTAPPRPKPISIETCKQYARREGLEAVFDAFLGRLRQFDARRTARQTNIGFAFPDRTQGSRRTLIALWPSHFERGKGILISYWQDGLRKAFPSARQIDFDKELPGRPGPIVGYLNSHRYLLSVEDVALFWNLMSE
jgi:hypothetical protein